MQKNKDNVWEINYKEYKDIRKHATKLKEKYDEMILHLDDNLKSLVFEDKMNILSLDLYNINACIEQTVFPTYNNKWFAKKDDGTLYFKTYTRDDVTELAIYENLGAFFNFYVKFVNNNLKIYIRLKDILKRINYSGKQRTL